MNPEERRKKVFEMRNSGMKWKDIAKAFGISPARATQLAKKHVYEEAKRACANRDHD